MACYHLHVAPLPIPQYQHPEYQHPEYQHPQAASPVFRGFLADVDCRWDVISGSVDCRTPQELGEEPLTTDRMVISKSRYASVSSYLSESPLNLQEYQDIPLEIDEGVYRRLKGAGFTERLALHFAHLFIRDPLVVYEEYLDQDDTTSTDHFEV